MATSKAKDYTSDMKKSLFLFFLLSATMAFGGVIVQNGKISADLNSEPLRQVLDKLKTQTDIHFSVEGDVAGQVISANFHDLPLAAAIKKMLEGTGMNYAVLGDAEGEAQTVFIGNSERPGSQGQPMDNRTMTMPNRGVVTPVAPMPQPSVQQPPPQMGQPGNETKPAPLLQPSVNVPTGGGFVPDSRNNPQEPQKPQPPNQQQEDQDSDEPN